jgi:hypothetical protein
LAGPFEVFRLAERLSAAIFSKMFSSLWKTRVVLLPQLKLPWLLHAELQLTLLADVAVLKLLSSVRCTLEVKLPLLQVLLQTLLMLQLVLAAFATFAAFAALLFAWLSALI